MDYVVAEGPVLGTERGLHAAALLVRLEMLVKRCLSEVTEVRCALVGFVVLVCLNSGCGSGCLQEEAQVVFAHKVWHMAGIILVTFLLS